MRPLEKGFNKKARRIRDVVPVLEGNTRNCVVIVAVVGHMA